MRSFGLSRARGRRAVPRTAAPLVAELSTVHARHSAILVDLSRTGARLRGGPFPDEGEGVTFATEKIELAGEIIWVEGDQCGVEFGTPLATNEVTRIRALAEFISASAVS
jgi:hypothetical protein